MRIVLFLSVLVLSIACKKQANPGNIRITGYWKYTCSDDSLFACQEYDDSAWETIDEGKTWKDDYSGVAWCRKQVIVPQNVRKHEIFQRTGYLVLSLGRIGDADETYFNGYRIGKTGSIIPFEGNSKIYRSYIVPDSIIRWGQKNLIAVRINGQGTRKGLLQGSYRLHVHPLQHFGNTKIRISNDDDGVFYGNDTMKLVYRFRLDSNSLLGMQGKIVCNVSNDYEHPKTIYSRQEQSYVLSVGDSLLMPVAFRPPLPGFYRFAFTIFSLSNDTIGVEIFKCGYEPEKIPIASTKPADIDDFWIATKTRLASIPLSFSLHRVDSFSNSGVETFLVDLLSYDSIIVRGWYCKPKKKGQYPAVLELPYFSGSLPPRNTYEDLVVFTLHIRGHGMSSDMLSPGFPGFFTWNITDKEKYIYRGAYMDCIRALDFLCVQPEVDTHKIAVFGSSQGGGLTFATASLDSRVKYALAFVPFLSCYHEYFLSALWPVSEVDYFIKTHPAVTKEKVLQTLAYFDIMNISSQMKATLYMVVGLQDIVCPPLICFAAYNNVESNKSFSIYPYAGHSAGKKDNIDKTIKDFFEKTAN